MHYIHYRTTILPKSQCGFKSNRSTIDAIFTLRQTEEKSIEQKRPLYMVFIDFTKAFDTFDHELLWKVQDHHRRGVLACSSR